MKMLCVLAIKKTSILGSQLIVLKLLLSGKLRKLKAINTGMRWACEPA